MREDVDMAVSFARSFKSNRKGAASPALDRPQLESAAAAAASAAQAAAALRERGSGSGVGRAGGGAGLSCSWYCFDRREA